MRPLHLRHRWLWLEPCNLLLLLESGQVHQMNASNVFLHGDLHKEFYMKLPSGFSQGHEGKDVVSEITLWV